MGKAFYETRSENFFLGEMTRYAFPLHVHDIVEMALLLQGECEMEIDGKPVLLRPGDAAVAFPFIPHAFTRISPEARGLAAFFPADMLPDLSSVFQTMLPGTPVVRACEMNGDALLAAAKLDTLPQDSPSRLAYLHLLIANLLAGMRFSPAADYHERDLGGRAVRHVYDHACEDISLSSTARALGISQSYLSHLFSQQFHINFRHFIKAIRIDRAIGLMRDPCITLTQICFQCGYENARTFRRAFLRETGVLPAAYIRAVRGKEKTADDAR